MALMAAQPNAEFHQQQPQQQMQMTPMMFAHEGAAQPIFPGQPAPGVQQAPQPIFPGQPAPTGQQAVGQCSWFVPAGHAFMVPQAVPACWSSPQPQLPAVAPPMRPAPVQLPAAASIPPPPSAEAAAKAKKSTTTAGSSAGRGSNSRVLFGISGISRLPSIRDPEPFECPPIMEEARLSTLPTEAMQPMEDLAEVARACEVAIGMAPVVRVPARATPKAVECFEASGNSPCLKMHMECSRSTTASTVADEEKHQESQPASQVTSPVKSVKGASWADIYDKDEEGDDASSTCDSWSGRHSSHFGTQAFSECDMADVHSRRSSAVGALANATPIEDDAASDIQSQEHMAESQDGNLDNMDAEAGEEMEATAEGAEDDSAPTEPHCEVAATPASECEEQLEVDIHEEPSVPEESPAAPPSLCEEAAIEAAEEVTEQPQQPAEPAEELASATQSKKQRKKEKQAKKTTPSVVHEVEAAVAEDSIKLTKREQPQPKTKQQKQKQPCQQPSSPKKQQPKAQSIVEEEELLRSSSTPAMDFAWARRGMEVARRNPLCAASLIALLSGYGGMVLQANSSQANHLPTAGEKEILSQRTLMPMKKKPSSNVEAGLAQPAVKGTKTRKSKRKSSAKRQSASREM